MRHEKQWCSTRLHANFARSAFRIEHIQNWAIAFIGVVLKLVTFSEISAFFCSYSMLTKGVAGSAFIPASWFLYIFPELLMRPNMFTPPYSSRRYSPPTEHRYSGRALLWWELRPHISAHTWRLLVIGSFVCVTRLKPPQPRSPKHRRHPSNI